MSILYEDITHSSWLLTTSVIVAVVVGICGLIWILLCLAEEEEWTKGCTAWLAAICLGALITVFIYDKTPEHRYIRVDVSSITDWDTIIEKYNIGTISGKVLTLMEKEPLE